MMGVATFLIGLVPTYASIGIAAPLMVIALRLIQGFAMGGEWGGAVLMAFEYAPPGKRGFYASFPQIGFALGLCLSTGAITLLSSALSNDAVHGLGLALRVPDQHRASGRRPVHSADIDRNPGVRAHPRQLSGPRIAAARRDHATTGGTSSWAGWRAWAKARCSRSTRCTCCPT